MFELTNDQRKCFGLLPVEDHWVRIELTPSPYDCHTTIAYLDGTTVKKFVATGDHLYNEYELCEELPPIYSIFFQRPRKESRFAYPRPH